MKILKPEEAQRILKRLKSGPCTKIKETAVNSFLKTDMPVRRTALQDGNNWLLLNFICSSVTEVSTGRTFL